MFTTITSYMPSTASLTEKAYALKEGVVAIATKENAIAFATHLTTQTVLSVATLSIAAFSLIQALRGKYEPMSLKLRAFSVLSAAFLIANGSVTVGMIAILYQVVDVASNRLLCKKQPVWQKVLNTPTTLWTPEEDAGLRAHQMLRVRKPKAAEPAVAVAPTPAPAVAVTPWSDSPDLEPTTPPAVAAAPAAPATTVAAVATVAFAAVAGAMAAAAATAAAMAAAVVSAAQIVTIGPVSLSD